MGKVKIFILINLLWVILCISSGQPNNWITKLNLIDEAWAVYLDPSSASGGGISNNSGTSEHPSLAINSCGFPVVAWEDYTISASFPEIYIKQWNGSAWVGYSADNADYTGGGISNTIYQSVYPSLTLDSSSNPVVAWGDHGGGAYWYIYIRRWNGSAWVEIGSGSASGNGISMNNNYDAHCPSLTLDSSGNPIVAWNYTISTGGGVYLKKWNGSAWVEYSPGSALNWGISGRGADCPHLALDSSNYPVVAWKGMDLSGGYWNGYSNIYIKRWNGSAWVEIGTGSASGGGISNSRTYEPNFPSLALDLSGNPTVAWQDYNSGENVIYIKHWNGSVWVGYSAGSSDYTGGGISNNTGNPGEPSLAIDSSGNPMVAWLDNTSGSYEIYLKRWNDSAWVELYTGLVGGTGILYTNWPSLAFDSSGSPTVAWEDNTSGNYEIYIWSYFPQSQTSIPTLSNCMMIFLAIILLSSLVLIIRNKYLNKGSFHYFFN